VLRGDSKDATRWQKLLAEIFGRNRVLATGSLQLCGELDGDMGRLAYDFWGAVNVGFARIGQMFPECFQQQNKFFGEHWRFLAATFLDRSMTTVANSITITRALCDEAGRKQSGRTIRKLVNTTRCGHVGNHQFDLSRVLQGAAA
jgi:hypothetical protein